MDVGHDPPPDPIERLHPPPDPIKIATDTQLARHSEAIVMIVEQKILGSGRRTKTESKFVASGFIIGKNQDKRKLMVITCEHVTSSIVGVSKKPEILKVRLFGSTTTDSDAKILHTDKAKDLSLLSVAVQNVNNFPDVKFSSATDKPPETIVVTVGYYHPADALAELLNEPNLFPTMPGAVGGTILGPTVDDGPKGILINHDSDGMRGTSGSPLICHDTSTAIGVFVATTRQIHEAVSTETVIEFLQEWLEENEVDVDENDGIDAIIAKCVDIL